MRRLFLFLVILGLGSVVLWHFEDQRREAERERVETRERRERRATERVDPTPPVDPERPSVPGGDGEYAFIRGRTSTVWYGDGTRPDLYFEGIVEPTDATGERYDAREVVVNGRIAGLGGGTVLRETIQAGGASFALRLDRGRPDQSGLSSDEPLALRDVVITRHIDAPVLPLELSAPRILADVQRERFETVDDDELTLNGPGLSGGGREVVFEGRTGFLQLGREWHTRLVLSGSGVVDFHSTGDGPLDLQRRLDDENAFDLIAKGGARLELVDARGATMDADEIALGVRTVQDPETGEDVQVLESARATGNVVVTQDGDRFVGERARVETLDGELRRFILEGQPAARVALRDADGTRVDVTVSGAGPLIVESDPERIEGERRGSFSFAGPGRVDAPARGTTITFEDRCDADAREEAGRARVVAVGDVILTRDDVRVETASLAATFLGAAPVAEGDVEIQEIVAVTEGPTRLTGATRDGGFVRADARGGLAAHLVSSGGDDEAWIVDRATDVTVEFEGADPFRAYSNEILDLDLAARTFRTEGEARYESLWGEALAPAGMVRDLARLVLHGAEEAPATLTLEPDTSLVTAPDDAPLGGPGFDVRAGSPLGAAREGELVARTIELTEQYLDAVESVSGYFDTAEGRLEIDAAHVRVTRLAPTEGEDGAEPVTLVADVVERIELFSDLGGFKLAAGRVEVDGSADSTQDTPRIVASVVTATGEVALDMQTVDGDVDLDANDLRIVRGAAAWDVADANLPEAARPKEGSLVDAFHLKARTVEQLELRRPAGVLRAACRELSLRGRFQDRALARSESVLVAFGDVAFSDDGPAELTAECEKLTLEDGERATLEPAAGERVSASGRLPGRGADAPRMPYTLDAVRLVHRTDFIEAVEVDVELEGMALPFAQAAGAVLTQAKAGRLVATPDEIVLDGGVHAFGEDRDRVPMEFKMKRLSGRPVPGSFDRREEARPIEAQEVREGGPVGDGGAGGDGGGPRQDAAPDDDPQEPERQSPLAGVIQGLQADGPEIRYGSLRVTGASLGETEPDIFHLVGDTDRPATIEYMGMSLEATWFRFDTREFLLEAGRGILRSAPGDDEWSLAFASIDRVIKDDESLIVIASPRLVRGRDEARADWISMWVLREAWRAKGNAAFFGEGEAPAPPPPAFVDRDVPGPDLLADALLNLQRQEFAGYARALYAEGDIEVTQDGARASRADALYLDVNQASAWLTGAEIVQRVDAGSRSELVRIRSERLETDASGRLIADRATLTTCDHDDPHYVVLTQQLALEPRDDGRWRFGARGNRLRFANGLQVPLPSIGNAVLDERGDFEGFENEDGEVTPLNSLTLAQTARFGASIGASFGFEVGDIGRWFADMIGMDTNILRGRWDTEAKWLGDRGPLVSGLLDLRERKPRDEVGEDFRLQLFLAGIPDRGEDRGVLRVAESDRDEGRYFGWLRGRYPIVRGEWVDVAFAGQTDAGVQPEFFEGEYLEWDERDTFVRWRKAMDGIYLQAGASKRVDSYRTEVEELPSVGAYAGKRTLGGWGPWSLLYGGSLDVAHLRRREGDPGRDPFSDVPGGIGRGLDGRETVRGRLVQRLDASASTGLAGIRALPYVELDATAWSEDAVEEDDVSRMAILGGFDLSTTLVAQDAGFTSVIAPRIGYRTDLAYEEDGFAPALFDEVERPIDGDIYEAGFRGLWSRPGTFENLDLDARIQRIENRESAPNTTQLALLGQWITRVGGNAEGRLGLLHDGRYDVEESETTYSRSTVAWSPREDFLIEGRYARARGFDRRGLYEAVGVNARWTLDPKWELEVKHEWSLKGEGSLNTGVVIRRFAHDFLLEFDVSRRAGEGGTSFGISFNPLLAWKRPRLGLLDRR